MPILESPADNRSLAEILSELTDAERAEAIGDLTPAQAIDLQYDWSFWGRPKQQEPKQPYFCWLLLAGRGFGKTKTGAAWVIARVHEARRKKSPIRIALIAETAADARDVLIEGESGIMQSSHPDWMPIYQPSKRRLIWPDGTTATTFSGDEPGQLRGPQFHYAWVDEIAKYTYPDDTWDNLEFGLRLGDNPQVVVTTTPRPIPIISTLVDDPLTLITTGSSYENIGNLAPTFITRVLKKYEGTRTGRQELHAEVLRDTPGSLWSYDLLGSLPVRVSSHPPLVRIVVAIDPATSSEDDANETGIVVVGRGEDHRAYVLRDASANLSPDGWATMAIGLYRQYNADRIIAERNNGGEMVERVLRSRDAHIPYRAVWASRGKSARAEPVAALYEQGKVSHVGQFARMEDQMVVTTPDGYLGPGSPDRMDALVWALTELMFGAQASGDPDKYKSSRR